MGGGHRKLRIDERGEERTGRGGEGSREGLEEEGRQRKEGRERRRGKREGKRRGGRMEEEGVQKDGT